MPLLLTLMCVLSGPAEMTPAETGAWLKALHEKHASYAARLDAVARAAADTPYAGGPLGEGPSGAYDPDPLMDLTRVDCVTYIEQCAALAARLSYREAWDTLQRIRYRDGIIGFETRNHFMVADWLANNTWCADRTAQLGVPVQTLTRTISRKDFFKRVDAPALGQDLPGEEITIQYVATNDAVAAKDTLPTPGLVVFVGNIDWLFALHTGLYLRDDGGAGGLWHASSRAERVVRTDLVAYLEEHAERYRGFMVFEVGAPAWSTP